jgi:hypothetical protein
MDNTIFIDESGYTGEDLFNAEQPFFTLASLNLSEEKCKFLTDKYFGEINARELKHSNILKYPKQQEMVTNFLKELANTPDIVKFSVSDKRYVLITKMVDNLIEPLLYESGYDLYNQGGNIGLSNVLYYMYKTHLSKIEFEDILRNFQIMMRERTTVSYENFFKIFNNTFSNELDELNDFFKLWYLKKSPEDIFSFPKNNLNIAFTCAFKMVADWSKISKKQHSLIHDNSSNMSKEKKLWDYLVGTDIPSSVVGYDTRIMKLPIQLKETSFVDSKDWSGLQLADILAGSINYVFKWLEDIVPESSYPKEVHNIVKDTFNWHLIIPTPKVTPEELGTVGPNYENPNDFFGKLHTEYKKQVTD